MRRTPRLAISTPRFALALLLGSWAGPGFAAAAAGADLPPLRPGLWRYQRTVEDPATPGSTKVLEHEECADPVADMQAMNEKLVKIGCRFSPATREGNVYRFTATCQLSGAGEAVSVSELTYLSEESYDLKVEAEGIPGAPSGGSSEKLTARRVGDCK